MPTSEILHGYTWDINESGVTRFAWKLTPNVCNYEYPWRTKRACPFARKFTNKMKTGNWL